MLDNKVTGDGKVTISSTEISEETALYNVMNTALSHNSTQWTELEIVTLPSWLGRNSFDTESDLIPQNQRKNLG